MTVNLISTLYLNHPCLGLPIGIMATSSNVNKKLVCLDWIGRVKEVTFTEISLYLGKCIATKISKDQLI